SQIRFRTESERLLALHHASALLATQIADPKAVIQEVLRSAVALLGADAASLYRWDEAANLVRCVVSWQMPSEGWPPDARWGEGLAGRTLVKTTPLIVNDYDSWEFARKSGRTGGLRAALGVPLRRAGRPIGVLLLRVYRADWSHFTADDAQLASLFGDQA